MGCGPVGVLAVLTLAARENACHFAVMVEPAKPKDPARESASRDDWYGLREGEVAAALPEEFDASLYYIGRIRTPWQRREDCPKNARQSDAVCTVELDPRWAEGLTGLETRQPRAVALLDGQSAARSFGAVAAPLHRAPRHLRAALAGAAQPDRSLGGAARPHRRQHAFGHRSRLPRQYAAPRHQAVFRVDRFRTGRAGRLACRARSAE